ncbi:hypothetical protein C8N36_105239 [Pelagimonas varians]|uniref:Lipoprotein n=1 Tax=Pelagimonas varians TaxID=696760 RepID=A0A238KAG0_9RHOB|nr:hypothetical protein C8N36_105239 [Pelagimonas varians]SMX39795.1 hypothetical protein PEV8663_01879 [Pelagimonas varians]
MKLHSQIMRSWLLFLLFVLGACDAAGPGFKSSSKIERSIEGTKFALRRQGDVVEAIRLSPEFLPKFTEVARKAAIVAQLETGCAAKWVDGDPALLRIGMSCNGARPPKKPSRRKSLYCDIEELYGRGNSYAGHMICR